MIQILKLKNLSMKHIEAKQAKGNLEKNWRKPFSLPMSKVLLISY